MLPKLWQACHSKIINNIKYNSKVLEKTWLARFSNVFNPLNMKPLKQAKYPEFLQYG